MEHLSRLKKATCLVLIKHISLTVRKSKLSLSNKARREASRNKIVKESRMLGSVKSLRRIKNRSSAWVGFVKSIQNGQRKMKNFIKSRLTRAETGPQRRASGVGLAKRVVSMKWCTQLWDAEGERVKQGGSRRVKRFFYAVNRIYRWRLPLEWRDFWRKESGGIKESILLFAKEEWTSRM